MIPPTINLREPDEEINPEIDLTPISATKVQVDVAINNTFGFGGHTVTTLFRRYYK
jgi:3-oxoacyl-[acyl-carrier-protein] synthase II